MQIAAGPRGTQIRERGAGAPATPGRGLEKSCALLRSTVEIRIGRNAGFSGCHDEGLRQRIGMPPIRYRQRPAGAVIFIGATLLVLSLLEIGQYVVIAPAGIAALTPTVVILVLAAHIQ